MDRGRGENLDLALVGYGIERRKTARGRFSGATVQDRWRGMDERPYNGRLPRPTSVPHDVLIEASTPIIVSVYIGHFNLTSKILEFKS